MRHLFVNVVDIAGRSPRLCGIRSSTSLTSRGCAGPCFVLAYMLALSRLRLPYECCVFLLCMRLLYMQALCALVLPMLALRAPAVRALAVHARAVRFRAVRVLCLCSAHLHHAELVDIADNTPLINRSSALPTTDPTHTLPVFAHFLIPFKGLIPLILINSVVPGVDLITSSG